MQRFSELCKEFDNYIWFGLGCVALLGAWWTPPEISSAFVLASGLAFQRAKKD